MCPINIPDPETELLDAIAACDALFGAGKYCSLDIAEWIDRQRNEWWEAHQEARSSLE